MLEAVYFTQFSTNQETYEIASLLITKYLCHAISNSTELKPAESLAVEIYGEKLPFIDNL